MSNVVLDIQPVIDTAMRALGALNGDIDKGRGDLLELHDMMGVALQTVNKYNTTLSGQKDVTDVLSKSVWRSLPERDLAIGLVLGVPLALSGILIHDTEFFLENLREVLKCLTKDTAPECYSACEFADMLHEYLDDINDLFVESDVGMDLVNKLLIDHL